MIDDKRVAAERITEERGRGAALEVLSATYQREKGWITDPDRHLVRGARLPAPLVAGTKTTARLADTLDDLERWLAVAA